jgi:hypothetical protein
MNVFQLRRVFVPCKILFAIKAGVSRVDDLKVLQLIGKLAFLVSDKHSSSSLVIDEEFKKKYYDQFRVVLSLDEGVAEDAEAIVTTLHFNQTQ